MFTTNIPDKRYFKIGEVSKLVGVKPYVLRYWETKFRKEVGPMKSRSNQRLYRQRDVRALLAIKQLLYDEGFTISGARRKLKDMLRDPNEEMLDDSSELSDHDLPQDLAEAAESLEQMRFSFDTEGTRQLLLKLKKDLQALKALIKAQSA